MKGRGTKGHRREWKEGMRSKHENQIMRKKNMIK